MRRERLHAVAAPDCLQPLEGADVTLDWTVVALVGLIVAVGLTALCLWRVMSTD